MGVRVVEKGKGRTVKDVADEVRLFGIGGALWPAFRTLLECVIRHDGRSMVLDAGEELERTEEVAEGQRPHPSIHEYPTPSENCSFCRQRIDRGR